jgi:hypothetical protein
MLENHFDTRAGLKNGRNALCCNASFAVWFEKIRRGINATTWTLNQRVPGSSPGAPTNRFKYLRGFPAVIATSHQGLAMFCGLLVKSCESIQALADQAKEIGVPGIRRLVVECVLKRAVIRSNAPGAAR